MQRQKIFPVIGDVASINEENKIYISEDSVPLTAPYSATCELEIDLNKIRSNYSLLQNLVKSGTNVAAVVKADSYGLGAIMISQTLQQIGCREFFVARCCEGIALKEGLSNNFVYSYKETNSLKSPLIYVLNGVYDDDINNLYHNNLIPVLNNLHQIKLWNEFAFSKSTRLPCIIQINIGMHRMGLQEKDYLNLLKDKSKFANLDIHYLLGHLTASEDRENTQNIIQLQKFTEYLSAFGEVKASLANSAGIFLGEKYHFDLVRPGASLYGLHLNDNMRSISNPIKLTAPIIHLQELAKGDKIGYNSSFETQQGSIIATIPLGYADGILRSFSNQGIVCLDKLQLPVVGRVSMDYITVDVTAAPRNQIYLGQRLEILGDDMPPHKFASLGGSFGYEILVNLGNRYKRKYKNVSTL